MLTLSDRISGGLFGLLIGDALGVPFEFHPPSALPPHDQIDFQLPRNFRRSHPSVRPGTWSDDSAQALCLLSTLLECGSLDLQDFSRKLLLWHRQSAFTSTESGSTAAFRPPRHFMPWRKALRRNTQVPLRRVTMATVLTCAFFPLLFGTAAPTRNSAVGFMFSGLANYFVEEAMRGPPPHCSRLAAMKNQLPRMRNSFSTNRIAVLLAALVMS
jgi:ADP-ribosylglycohydrolase